MVTFTMFVLGGGSLIPFEIAQRTAGGLSKRDLQSTQFATGGAFVASEMMDAVAPLLNRSILGANGARVISGLSSNILKPRSDSPTTPSQLSEIAAIPQTDLVFSQQSFTPKRIGARVIVSTQLYNQGGDLFFSQILKSAFDRFAQVIDINGVNGIGSSSSPVGVLNLPGVQTFTFGGDASWSNVMSMKNLLEAANADSMPAWAVSPATALKWRTNSRGGGYPTFTLQDGKIDNDPVSLSNQLASANQAIYGSFGTATILIFGRGFEVVGTPTVWPHRAK